MSLDQETFQLLKDSVQRFVRERLMPAEDQVEEQDEVPAAPFADIRALAEAELGIPLAIAYASFEEHTVAAASLGQAHRAVLTPADAAETGFTHVIVKVQRPGIEGVVDVDLAALRRVAGQMQVAEKHPNDKAHTPHREQTDQHQHRYTPCFWRSTGRRGPQHVVDQPGQCTGCARNSCE